MSPPTPALPKTFKQAVFKAQGQPLTLEDAELTLPAPGEILVKVEACGVCFSDMFAQNNVMGGGFPIVPGHEIIGYVAAVADGEKLWKVGERVGGAWHGGHDGTCKACRKGYFQMCDNAQVNGETRSGGYAEYCKLRSESAVHVPAHIDAAKYAPIMCAGISCFNAIRRQNIGPGELVAVQGLGGLGHLAIQYAVKMGYRVAGISRGADKEKLVKQLGAHEYIDSSVVDPAARLKELGGASLIVTTAPSADVIAPLQAGLGLLGKLLVLSVPGDIAFNTYVMLKYGCSMQIWPCGHSIETEEAIAFTELQNINCMIEKYPLKDAQKAFEDMLAGTVRFRAVITMD